MQETSENNLIQAIIDDQIIAKITNDYFLTKSKQLFNSDENQNTRNKYLNFHKIHNLIEEDTSLINQTLLKAKKHFPKEYFDKIIFVSTHYLQICDEILPFIKPLVSHNVYFEWLMYLEMDKIYRDHLTHQYRVACLGQWFLDEHCNDFQILKKIKDSKPLQEFSAKIDFNLKNFGKEDLRKAWWIAALFHDWGYLFTTYSKLEQKISNVFFTYNTNSINNFDLLLKKSSFSNSMVFKYFEKQLITSKCFKRYHLNDIECKDGYHNDYKSVNVESYEDVYNLIKRNLLFNHSVLGALNLLLAFDQLQKEYYVDNKTKFIFELAAMSILTHDFDSNTKFKGFDNNINYEEYPLSFFLIFCDQLQDWQRPILKYSDKPNKDETSFSKVITFENACKNIDINLNNNLWNINYHFYKENSRLKEWEKERQEIFDNLTFNNWKYQINFEKIE